jgi:hypothetical protein
LHICSYSSVDYNITLLAGALQLALLGFFLDALSKKKHEKVMKTVKFIIFFQVSICDTCQKNPKEYKKYEMLAVCRLLFNRLMQ